MADGSGRLQVGLLLDQVDHVERLVRHSIDGLTDDDLTWAPPAAPEVWTARPEGVLGGRWLSEGRWPDPQPPPFTTIAWRLAHMSGLLQAVGDGLAGVSGTAAVEDVVEPGTHAGAGPLPEGSAAALVGLWHVVHGRVRAELAWPSMSDDKLAGPVRMPWEPDGFSRSHAQNVWLRAVHEQVHHGAEIGCLRDVLRNGS